MAQQSFQDRINRLQSSSTHVNISARQAREMSAFVGPGAAMEARQKKGARLGFLVLAVILMGALYVLYPELAPHLS